MTNDLEIIKRVLQLLRINAAQLGDFMYAAVRDASQDMLKIVAEALAAVERLEAERQSDTEIVDWLEKYPDFQVNTYTQAGIRQVHLVGGAGTAMCRVGSSIRSIVRAAIESAKENANE